MATYTQGQYTVGSNYYNYFLSQVPVGKDYIIFSTQSEYYLVYGDYDGNVFNDSTVLSIARSNSGGVVDRTEETTTTVKITYDYYTYSNIGHGTFLVSPVETHNNIQISHYSFIVLLLLLFVTIGFSVVKKRWM